MAGERFAIFGARFWARFQLAAWGESDRQRCVASYNRTREKPEALARKFGVLAVYGCRRVYPGAQGVHHPHGLGPRGTKVGFGASGGSPCRAMISAKPRLAACTRTSPGRGSGSAASRACSSSGPPCLVTQLARIAPLASVEPQVIGGCLLSLWDSRMG